MLCQTVCACALTSTLGTISVSGSGTPGDPWVIETANATSITQLQIDVANILAALDALPDTYVNEAGDIMSGDLEINTASGQQLTLRRTGDGPVFGFNKQDGSRIGYLQGNDPAAALILAAESGNALIFRANAADVMRILTSGIVLVGKSASNVGVAGVETTGAGIVSVTNASTTNGVAINKIGAGVASGTVFIPFQLSGSTIGSISRNAATSAVLYNTTSDEDLKNIIGELDGELAEYVLRLITPVFYSWKDDKGNTPIAGYIAQQVAAAWPESIELGIVTPGYGDINDRTWDEDGNETTPEGMWGPWMMSITGLIPLLHAFLARKARQLDNLRAEYDEFKTTTERRLAALEVK